jgi:platelet-activating factor acetylhydrolase
MTSFFSALNPTPSFPAYTGPFQVGSAEYEIPISELRPEDKSPKAEISTVQFRVFYPSEKASDKTKPVRWIPEPQRGYLDGYARFGGAGKTLSSILG